MATPIGRQVQQDAEVAGDAEPPRMGDAVAVDEQQVRLDPELLERRQRDRRLAKRQQSRDVRKRHRPGDDVLLDDLQPRERQHDDGGPASHDAGRGARIGEVDPGHRADRPEVVGARDLAGERS